MKNGITNKLSSYTSIHEMPDDLDYFNLRPPARGEVKFIDDIGRTYTSWLKPHDAYKCLREATAEVDEIGNVTYKNLKQI